MKRKAINDSVKIDGFYAQDLIRGFLGERGEGKAMLQRMGILSDVVPFSVVSFIQNRKIFWKDKNGRKVSISFRLRDNQLECFGNYRGKRKSMRLFREWNNYEDSDMVAQLESEAIGELCMKCISEITLQITKT